MKHVHVALFALLACCSVIVGCGSQGVKPQTPRQVYAIASGDFDAAQAIVLKYEALQPCNGTTPSCRNEATVNKIKAAVKEASDALDTARKTIDDPAFSQGGAQAALAVAQNALSLLTSIIASLPVK